MSKITFLSFEQPISDLESKIEELRFVQEDSAVDITEEIDRLSQKSQQLTKDLFAKLVLLQQVAEGQDRGLIRDPITDQLDAGKAAHGGHLDQGLFHGWVAERIPMLQQVDAQHHRQWIRRPAALLAARVPAVGVNPWGPQPRLSGWRCRGWAGP